MSVKVLIVDDTLFMRNNLAKLIRDHGWQVVAEAENGLKAVEAYRTHRPDVVTMDITMPELDGIGAVRQIMAFDPKAKIVMCSAMGQQNLVVEAVRAGAKDFVVKPFQKERVLEALEAALKK